VLRKVAALAAVKGAAKRIDAQQREIQRLKRAVGRSSAASLKETPAQQGDRMATPNVFPAVRYRDANAAIEFLKEAFGFCENMVHRDDDGRVVHAQLQLGAGMIMLGQHHEEGFMGGKAPDPLASTGSVYVVVPDPDAHHATAKAAGANIVRELDDMEYGSREYSARDLEGNLWSFGTYDPYASD
jgi:uncharacterized glyoxalase superfamily protein PhnB